MNSHCKHTALGMEHPEQSVCVPETLEQLASKANVM